MTQNNDETMFFETNDDTENKRQQQRQLPKTKFLESFDADPEQKLGEKKKTLKWLFFSQYQTYEKMKNIAVAFSAI